MLGLRFCARAFPSRGERGPLSITARGPLTVAASPAAEHRLQTRRLSSCGSRAQLLRGMWDPPRPGLEPVSPALAGRLSTAAPPGKPQAVSYKVKHAPAIPPLSTCPGEMKSCLYKDLYMNIHSSFIYKQPQTGNNQTVHQ